MRGAGGRCSACLPRISRHVRATGPRRRACKRRDAALAARAAPAPGSRCRTARSRCGRPACGGAPSGAPSQRLAISMCDVDALLGRARPRRRAPRRGSSTMPSLSEKPSAKSSRSCGVASITACEMPLYCSATGTSSATQSPAWRRLPLRQASVCTGKAPARSPYWAMRTAWSWVSMASVSITSPRHQRVRACAAPLQQLELLAVELAVVALPLRGLRHRHHLHRRHLVLGAVGRPVGVVGGDHVGARLGEVEGGVDHARLHALGDRRAQHRLAGAAGDADPVAVADAALLGVVRMDLEPVFVVPLVVGACAASARRRCTATGCGRWSAAAGSVRVTFSSRRHVLGDDEAALAAHEVVDVHDGRAASGGVVVARPLHAAELVELRVAHAGKVGVSAAISSMISRRVRCSSSGSRARSPAADRDLPVGQAGQRRHHLAHARDAALGVGEGAVLLEEATSPAGTRARTWRSRSGRCPARRGIPSPTAPRPRAACWGRTARCPRPGSTGP